MWKFEAGGHEWKIPRLTNGDILDIQDDTEIHIYKLAESGGDLFALLLEPFRFGAVLWSICKKQAAERGIDERGFARLLTSDVTEKAGELLCEAIVDFFPRAKAAASMKADLRGTLAKLDDKLIAHSKNLSGVSVA